MRRSAWIRCCSGLQTLASYVVSGKTEIAQAEASLSSYLDSMNILPLHSSALTAQDAGDIVWCLYCACPPENESLSSRISDILLRLHERGRRVSFSQSSRLEDVMKFIVQVLGHCSGALTTHIIICAATCMVREHLNKIDSHQLEALVFALVRLCDMNTSNDGELMYCIAVEGIASILSINPKLLGHASLTVARDCAWHSFDCHWRKSVSCECISMPYIATTTHQLVSLHLRMVIAGSRGLQFAIKMIPESSWTQAHVGGLVIALNNIVQPQLLSETTTLIEGGSYDADNDRQLHIDLHHELIIECLGLLGILASKCPMILLPHWGLFLPTRVESHMLSPAGMAPEIRGKAVIKPAGLVCLMKSSSSPATIRRVAATVASEMVRRVPLKLIMKPSHAPVRGRAAPHAMIPRGISERLAPMITCLYETILVAIEEEDDPATLASILKCGCSLAEGILYLPLFDDKNGYKLPLMKESIDILLVKLLTVTSHLILMRTDDDREEEGGNNNNNSLKCCRSEASHLLATALSQPRPLAACNSFLSGFTGDDDDVDQEMCNAAPLGFVHKVLSELINSDQHHYLPPRTDHLYLISRIGRKYHWHLLSHCNWPNLFAILLQCFRDIDQNTRLHGLKVVEELLHARAEVVDRCTSCFSSSLVDSDPCSSWGEVLRNFLSCALSDPYHGVRSVAVSCHGLFLPRDWVMIGDEDSRIKRMDKLLNVLNDDVNTGVSSNACHTIGMIMALKGGDGWNMCPSLIEMVMGSLLPACRGSRVAVSMKAMVALGQVVRAIFREERQRREELIRPKDALEVCAVAADALEQQGKSGPIASQILGYMAALEAQAEPSWLVVADLKGMPTSVLTSAITDPGDHHDTKCLWNCCAALGTALSDSDAIQALEERGQLSAVLSGLCGIITSPCSPTFMNQGWCKARTYAAVALAIPSCHSSYSSSLLEVVTAAALAVADWHVGKRNMFPSSSTTPNCAKETKSYEAVHEALMNLAVHVVAVVALGGKQPTEGWWISGQEQWVKFGASPMCADILEALLEALSSATAVETTLGSWTNWMEPTWMAQLYEKVRVCTQRGSGGYEPPPQTAALPVHVICAAACCASLSESARCFPGGNVVVVRLKSCCRKWLQLNDNSIRTLGEEEL